MFLASRMAGAPLTREVVPVGAWNMEAVGRDRLPKEGPDAGRSCVEVPRGGAGTGIWPRRGWLIAGLRYEAVSQGGRLEARAGREMLFKSGYCGALFKRDMLDVAASGT